MTANYEYSRINRENLQLPNKAKLSKKPSIFCCSFFAFLGSKLNLQCFKKKMSVRAQVFLKLLTPRDVVVWMHNRACFLKAYCSQRVNEFQKLLQYGEKSFYPTFSSFWAKLSYKRLFLIRPEIWGLLDNTLTANCEYYRINRENLQLPNKAKLSKKPSIFCCIFVAFFTSKLNFQCFKKKMSLIAQVFLKLLAPRDVLV